MNDHYVHITLIVDRSGSMEVIKAEAEHAVNAFVDEQKKVEGKATLLLVDFDTEYRIVYEGDIAFAARYVLIPRSMTALLDAIDKGITQTGDRLSILDEADRPAKVIFVVQTDGQENSSYRANAATVTDRIRHQTETYGWEFVFLGMGPDTFAQGHRLGFGTVAASADTGVAYVATYDFVGQTVTAVRNATAGGLASNMSAAAIAVDADGNVTPNDPNTATSTKEGKS